MYSFCHILVAKFKLYTSNWIIIPFKQNTQLRSFSKIRDVTLRPQSSMYYYYYYYFIFSKTQSFACIPILF